MADVLHRVTKVLSRSVNTTEFPALDYIHNPDLSAVAGHPSKHWIINGDEVSLMSPAERVAADNAESAAQDTAETTAEKSRFDGDRIVKGLALVLLDEVNLLRANAGLNQRTENQLVNAVKAKIEAL